MTTERAFIYAITNKNNDKKYIGSSVRPDKRFSEHKHYLRKGNHHSFILQAAWNKYGENAFEFKVIIECAKSQRYMYEQLAMKLQSYNILRTVREHEVRGGWHHTDEFKAKLSQLNKGKKLSDEHKAKLSVSRIGMKMDQSFKDKARQRQIGVSPSTVTRYRLSMSQKLHHAETTNKTKSKVLIIYNTYKHKDNIQQLCQLYGLSAATFYSFSKKLNLIPLKQKIMHELSNKIHKMLETGMSMTAVAEQLGLSVSSARGMMVRRGLL